MKVKRKKNRYVHYTLSLDVRGGVVYIASSRSRLSIGDEPLSSI